MFLKRLTQMTEWDAGSCKKLKGSGGYWELRWSAEKVEHRILGYFDSEVFNMLVGCTHKGKVYDPQSAFDTMRTRHKQILDGSGSLKDYELR